jgi:hypothetical protein
VTALLPAETPNTVPEELIVATDVLPLVHDPPPLASLNEVVLPAQTVIVPVIAAGNERMVTVVVVKHPVPNV